MRNLVLFGVFGGLYAGFWRWYTGSRRPLAPDEIERYLNRMIALDPDPQVLERIRAFAQNDTGRSFVMVNLIKLHDKPLPLEGTPADVTAMQMLNRYSSVFLPRILKRAGHPLITGRAAAEAVELWGVEDAAQWTVAGLVRYRSRRDMLEAVTDGRFEGIHPFKRAAIEKTIAFPVDPWFQTGEPRVILALLIVILALLLRRNSR